ncbi:unnamed protein product [Symbiodinium sp. CCMP2456]|nr:unnamed protein product [Symbiodinium sp. CCMP2456]
MASREDPKEAAPPATVARCLTLQRTTSKVGFPGQPTSTQSSTAASTAEQECVGLSQEHEFVFMPKAYSEMVPMTRESSFVGPGPVRANSDGIVQFLRAAPDMAPTQEEILFFPKSFSEVDMPSSRLSFQQTPAPSNSDGLLANRAFIRAVDAARAQAAQQAQVRLPDGDVLASVAKGKTYEGRIVKAFKLGLLIEIDADVRALLRWKHVKGVPRKLLKEGCWLAFLRVDKVKGTRVCLCLECPGSDSHETIEEDGYEEILARVHEWAGLEPKVLDFEGTDPVAKRHPGRNGPRTVGDGLPIRGPALFSMSRLQRAGKCGPRCQL